MPVIAADWVALAQNLVGRSEIADRSAASRAYYGAFHASKPLADKLPAPPPLPNAPLGGVHERTVRALKDFPVSAATRSRDMAIRRAGILMAQCRSLRTKADYDINLHFLQNEAEETIRLAQAVIASVQAITFP